MAGTDLDRLVAAWRAVDWNAAREHAFSPDSKKDVTEPSMYAAEDAESTFLDNHPDAADRWYALKDRLFGQQLQQFRGQAREALQQHEKASADAAAPLFWMGTPGRALVKGATLGYVDPVELLAPPGTAEAMDRYQQTREGAARVGTGAFALGSDLGSFLLPMGAVGALGRGIARGVPQIGRAVEGASRVAPLVTRVGKTAATAGTVGALQQPEDGTTRLENAASMAKWGAGLGVAGQLGGRVAQNLLRGRAAGPITEKAVAGGVGALAQGVGAAALAPSGERIETGLTYGIASIFPTAFRPQGTGRAAYEKGLKDRVAALRGAAKRESQARAKGDKAAAYEAAKEAAARREDVLAWRSNAEVIEAIEEHGDVREVARQRAVSQEIGEASQRIAADDARLRELEAQESQARELLRRLSADPNAGGVIGSIEAGLKRAQSERGEILARRPSLEIEEVKYGLPGMQVEVVGKSRRTGQDTSVRAVVRAVDGRTATVVDRDGKEHRVPLGAIRPINPESVQRQRAADSGRPPPAGPGAGRPPPVAPDQGQLPLAPVIPGPGADRPRAVAPDVSRETKPPETAIPTAETGQRPPPAMAPEPAPGSREAQLDVGSRRAFLQGLIKYMAQRKDPAYRDAQQAARAELKALNEGRRRLARALREQHGDKLALVDRERELRDIQAGRMKGPLGEPDARRMAGEELAAMGAGRRRGARPQRAEPASPGAPPMRVYRGRGRATREEVYQGPSKVALLPDATWYAFDEAVAGKYGPSIEQRDVQLRKPLVLDSDEKFRAVVKAAGIRYPKFWMDQPANVEAESRKLRDHIAGLGHDGVVVRNTSDSRNELLYEAFGDDQVAVFRQEGARPEVASQYERPIGPQREGGREASVGVEGRPTTVHTISGKYAARYKLVELSELVPSHRTDVIPASGVRAFAPDEHYPEGLQPRRYHEQPREQQKVERFARELGEHVDLYLGDSPTATDGPPIVTPDNIVLNGNGRAMSLKIAARTDDGRPYSAYLDQLTRDAARYGIDPAQLQGMRAPVLVRVVDMDARSDAAYRFAREGNESLMQAQSTEDRMRALAAVIPDEVLQLDVPDDMTLPDVLSGGSRAARAALDSIHDALPENIRPSFFTEKGTLSDAGKQAIGKLLLGSVIDPALAEKQRPSVGAMLTKSIPALSAMQRDLAPELNLRAHLEGALRYGVERLDNWEHGVGQGFLGFNPFGELPPEQQVLVQYISEHRNRDTALRHLMQEYVSYARGSQVFGQAHTTAHEALAGALRNMEKAKAEQARERAQGKVERGKATERPGEAGMVPIFGTASRELRRAWTRVMGGDARKAGEKWAYHTLAEMRPQLATAFRAENLDATLTQLAESGLRPDQVNIVRRLEAGVDPDAVRAELAPDASPPQFAAMASAAYAHALDIADGLHAKNALLFDSQQLRLGEFLRDWWNPRRPSELPTAARLRERGEAASVRTTEWWSPRRYAGELAENTSQEVANVVFGWQRRSEIRIKAFRRSMDTAAGNLRRLAELTGADKNGTEGLREGFLGRNKLSVAEVAAFDALDGLRRILGREGSQQEVADFIKERAAEFERLAPGAGRDWRNAVTIYGNMWKAVRDEYRKVYGRDISANIGEGLYAPHFFSDATTGRMLPWARLSKFFSDPIRSRVWSRFEMARGGREGYVPDVISAAELYFPGMLRKLALDGLLQEDSELSRAVFGRLVKARADVGGDLKRGVDGGAVADNPAGRRLAQWWNRLASNETMDDRRLQVWIPASAIERIRDANGEPIKPQGAKAEGGYYHFLRSGKPLGPGDRNLVIREARASSPEIVLPLVDADGKSPLRFMQWYSGGLQDIATMFGQEGRRAAAVEWMRRMKLSDRRSHWLIDNRVKDFLTDVIYHNTLGLGQWKPIANNIAGGLLMTAYHSGPSATASALDRYVGVTRGKDAEARLALLKMGVVEEEGVFLERAGGARDRGGRAAEIAGKASFAGFSSAERMLRSVSALAGHDKFLAYARGELERVFSHAGIPRSATLSFANRRLYQNGQLVPGSERLGSLLDATKRPTRTLTRVEIERELEEQALMHGRAAVAKTQFLYSAAFTPQAFTGPVGRAVFQLNQYPIRSAFALWDAIANEKDPAKVARWIATATTLGTAAWMMQWDVTAFVGPSIGSLLQSQTWDTDKETAGGQALDAVASLPVPTPIPFSRGAPYIPLLSMASGAWDILKGTLGLDPANPVPTGDSFTADLWARFGRAVELADRSSQSTLIPNQWRKAYEFATADRDAEGRRLVPRRGGTLSPQSPGEFAAEMLVPGSLRSTYGAFERSEKRQAREESANRVSRAYKENLARLQGETDPERRAFMERQNQQMLEDQPALRRVEQSDVRRLVEEQGLPIEVGELARSSLAERARGYFEWIEADQPDPDMLRRATRLLWGKDFEAVKRSIGELKKIDPAMGNRVLGAYRKAMRGEPVTAGG